MADINKVLNVRKDRAYQLNISVSADQAQAVADALDSLMRRDVYKSKSRWVCEAIIAYANNYDQGGQK